MCHSSFRLSIQSFLWFLSVEVCFAAEYRIRYDSQIRPILAEHCFSCHGPDASHRKADLRLDLESSAKEQLVSPSGESELLSRLETPDEALRMPPPDSTKRLNAKEIALIKQWIAEGALYEGHWAYQPIIKPDIPPPINPSSLTTFGSRTEIDRFIDQSLSEHGLTPAPQISRQQLIRRVTFDLTGLPPTWEAVDAFVNDTSVDAYARLIDRLLDSPAYGQRWGRHWLDLARYADTHGGAAIGFTKFPFSYTYRDYVIRAFNSDIPYDRFVLEQIAADQLGLSKDAPELSGLGFLNIGMQFRNRHDVIDDQIDVVTRGLMGLTVACARCHDHKFDAIPTKDYYALYASLADSKSPENLPIVGELVATPDVIRYQEQLEVLQHRYDEMAQDQNEIMRSRLRMQVGLYLRELAKGTSEQDVSTEFLSYRTDDLRPLITNRWLTYVAKMGIDDPVFGPWHRLMQIDNVDFSEKAKEVIQNLVAENPDATKIAEAHALAGVAVKWNPRVLDRLISKQPQSKLDVADAYGGLFAEVHQEWLQSLLQSALEAASADGVVPDGDPKHLNINSPIHRQIRWHLYGVDTPTAVDDDDASKLLNRTVSDLLNSKRTEVQDHHLKSPGSPPRAMALQESSEPKASYVFLRGDPLTRGDRVEPGFLSILSNSKATANKTLFKDGKRRLGLAQSVVDPENPLTRRVLVNWVWQHHFGSGLVRTPDDFGTRGRIPTHPKLLDYLADQFLEDGWSIKKLHRQILLSNAYQRASIESEVSRTMDPDNDFLWRMPRRRLDFESMRDAMLAASGELDLSNGGRPFDFNATPTIPRRSVYGLINRDTVSDLASTFDVANPNACTVKRPDTSVPQQTLFALNSDFVQDRAAKISELSLASAGSDMEQRVTWLYQRLLSRSPDSDEIRLASDFIASEIANESDSLDDKGNIDASSPSAPWTRFTHALLASNEFLFID